MSECTIYYAKIEIESSFLGHIRRFQHGLETNHGLQILYSWISIHSIGTPCALHAQSTIQLVGKLKPNVAAKK